jgi:hypothetical protein
MSLNRYPCNYHSLEMTFELRHVLEAILGQLQHFDTRAGNLLNILLTHLLTDMAFLVGMPHVREQLIRSEESLMAELIKGLELTT